MARLAQPDASSAFAPRKLIIRSSRCRFAASLTSGARLLPSTPEVPQRDHETLHAHGGHLSLRGFGGAVLGLSRAATSLASNMLLITALIQPEQRCAHEQPLANNTAKILLLNEMLFSDFR